jgi:hypothetical protein
MSTSKSINAWRRACTEPLQVPDSERPGEMMEPEPGTRYFIRQLARIGARSIGSCEGHAPDWHWYIAFRAPFKTAVRIEAIGYFQVALRSGQDLWTGKRAPPSWFISIERPDRCSKRERDMTLAAAAEAWDRAFGRLQGNA